MPPITGWFDPTPKGGALRVAANSYLPGKGDPAVRLPLLRVCAEILRSTVDLGHALGMQVVAEGVEDARTLALLRDLRCDSAQGWALGRPCAPAALDLLLRPAVPSPAPPVD